MSQGEGGLRLVFMGTPDFAVSVLRRLAAWPGGQVVAAYSQPDRPAGRGQRLLPTPVKACAEELGIPVMQPRNFRDEADRAELAAFRPDVLAVAAYGLILPQSVLNIPRLGPLNVHGSLLPRYRGAAPIQRAIMDGENLTGITIMKMEAGMDSGPILRQRALGIGLDDTAETLGRELADLGGRLLIEELEAIRAGEPSTPIPQDESLVTYADRLEKAEGFLDWNAPALALHARLRGLTPKPGARALFAAPGREPLPLLLSPGEIPPDQVPGKDQPAGGEPGQLLGLREGRLAVACADGAYWLTEVRPAGRKAMCAADFWNGYARSGGRFLSPQESECGSSR